MRVQIILGKIGVAGGGKVRYLGPEKPELDGWAKGSAHTALRSWKLLERMGNEVVTWAGVLRAECHRYFLAFGKTSLLDRAMCAVLHFKKSTFLPQ